MKEFKCREGCSACCGMVPIEKKLAKETESFAQVKPVEVLGFDGKIYIITKDRLCIYLNRKTKKCMIYDTRPEVCKNYGLIDELPCPYFRKDGTRRGLTEQKLTQVKIDVTVDKAIGLLK